MHVAVLDLGSTTFHLEHLLVTQAGIGETLHDEKRMLCLGERLLPDGTLPADAIEDSIEAVVTLLARARSLSPDHLVVVATSAIRGARNGGELVRVLERRCGISVRVVGPDEEARLAYVGQLAEPALLNLRVGVVDLGGGSVEIALGHGTRCLHTESLLLGAMRVRAALGRAQVDEAVLAQVRAMVQRTAGATAARVRAFAPDVLVLGSGSARSVRRLACREARDPGPAGPLDARDLAGSLERHIGLSDEELVRRGVDPKRAGSVLIATAVLKELIELCGPVPAHVSNRGLRDGVALEAHAVKSRGPRAASALLAGAVASDART